jgi:hypothetical protein
MAESIVAEPLGFDPLSAMRGLHLPEAISWWPPAPGWWILALLAVVSVVTLSLGLRRRLRSPLRAAKRELNDIEQRLLDGGDSQMSIVELSALLRRVAIIIYPNIGVAGLVGPSWLSFLDSSGATEAFSRGAGARIGSAPYQPMTDAEPAALLEISRAWIAAQAKRRDSRA